MSCLITKGYLMLLQGAELEYRVQTMVDKTSICPNYSEILILFATMGFRKSTIYFDFLMVCDVLCFCQFYSSIWQILCHFMTRPDALTDFDIDQALPGHWTLFSIYPQVQKMRQTQTPLCCDRTCYEVSEALRLCARQPREIHFCSGGCAHVCFLKLLRSRQTLESTFRRDLALTLRRRRLYAS